VLLGAGAAVCFVVIRSLDSQFDANLADRVLGFASILFQVEDRVEFEFSDQLMPEYQREKSPDYFELRFDDGRLLERSESLRGGDLLVEGEPGPAPSYWSAPLPDGRHGRYVAQLIEVHHVYPEEGPDRPNAAHVRVVIARGQEELAAAERAVLYQCGSACLVLIGMLGFLSWTAVRRGLEPANRLAATLDAIEVDSLPASLDVGELPSELEPVAETTNALIQRVDVALKRERRTTADMAHELRTPISEMLTVSEVALRNGLDVAGAKKALGTVRDVAWRMGRSLSTLLKLARLEMGAETFDRDAVDLGGIVSELLRSLSALERERELRVENLVGARAPVQGDREVLRIVVSNLLSNALYYSPTRGTVRCTFDPHDDGWRLQVENDARDLREEDLPALSEPFWRKDRARTDRDRSGLGLALSHALAEKAGMELAFELTDGKFRATLHGRVDGR
jgi:signal transduction histidine kinase